jgi:uncharacterized integral membrane protein
MKKRTIIVTSLGVLLLLIIFLQNTETVLFRILFWKIGMPRIVWFFVVFCIGIITGYAMQPAIARILKRK